MRLKYGSIGVTACREIYELWIEEVSLPDDLTPQNMELREKFLEIFRRIKADERSGSRSGRIDKYQFDLLLGLELYSLLNEASGFTMRHASDPDVWRYMTMRIAPDIVHDRWGKESSDRYFRRPTRIYFSSLWWYIHLSWTGNATSTYEILKSNSTDEIMNLVERAGSMGYRVDFTRELMKQYSRHNQDEERNLFRKVLKLNTARSVVLEPGLYTGGIEGYVGSLFRDVMKGELHEEASGSY